MTKKIIWILVSVLMVLSLVMASCGPAAEEEAEIETETRIEKKTETKEEKKAEEEGEGLLPPEVPKYGGWLHILGSDPLGFDEGYTFGGGIGYVYRTNEALTTGNFAKGIAGTGETDWWFGYGGNIDLMTGCLAESWDIPDDETLIFYMRHGIHFFTNLESEACNLVGGREVTAEDVVYELNRIYFELPKSAVYSYYKPEYKPISFTAKDKYTVEIKTVPGQSYAQFRIADAVSVYPLEVIEEYGNMNDWRNSCGTGPFILKDYVTSSSMTYIRNPDYWMHDALHPENQLPYYDGVKDLIIPDKSTQLAAMRTGKIEVIDNLSREEMLSVTNSNPNVIAISKPASCMCLTGRCDKPELPTYDIRVRQALNLAVNKQAIKDDYFEGHAGWLGVPYLDYLGTKDFFIPLEEQPSEPTIEGSKCSVQELFTYNPEKAKELLAEAGHPGGFTMKVTCEAQYVDYLSVLLADLAKVNVTLDIDTVDRGVYLSMKGAHTYEAMFHPSGGCAGVCQLYVMWRPEHGECIDQMEDPVVRASYDAVQAVVHRDTAEMNRLLKEIGPYILEQARSVWLPAPENYTLYHPWFQDYHGEGRGFGWTRGTEWVRNFWIDTALKESLGY